MVALGIARGGRTDDERPVTGSRLMKRVVATIAVVLVVAFLVGFGANALFFGGTACGGGCGISSAPANLESALTGADTFYTYHGSYAGIYDGSGVSTITEIMGGMTFVSGEPSTGPTVISLATNPRAGWLVMAAYGKATPIVSSWSTLRPDRHVSSQVRRMEHQASIGESSGTRTLRRAWRRSVWAAPTIRLRATHTAGRDAVGY
jgi:hypothetical protein